MNIRTVANPKIDSAVNYETSLGRPVLFTVSEPNSLRPLYDVILALHQNPDSLDEKYTKIKSITQTYTGFVEYHWPDDLDSISCESSTGAFVNKTTGLSSITQNGNERFNTIAYQKHLDLIDIFRNNGMIYDGSGKPIIRGRVIMMFDRGVYYGHFGSFSVSEDAEKPFMFKLSWDFKVEKSLILFGKPNV